MQLMRRSATEKVALLESLEGSWCELIVAKGLGKSQYLVAKRGVVLAVTDRSVEIDEQGTTNAYPLGELRGVRRPNGEVLGSWSGRITAEEPYLQTHNETLARTWNFDERSSHRRHKARDKSGVRGHSVVPDKAMRSTMRATVGSRRSYSVRANLPSR